MARFLRKRLSRLRSQLIFIFLVGFPGIALAIGLPVIALISQQSSSHAQRLLDQAVVDIETGEDQMARLNGYVHQLQAVDKRQDTDFVSVTIRFVDEDPKKLEDLSRFIARFRSGR